MQQLEKPRIGEISVEVPTVSISAHEGFSELFSASKK